ncbi:longevity-assurance protein (LAG1) domain-containing protein [Cardiosporidium cionae]|uniref:Longevity-assurance protein (LAG1) domain-containing protein n=1 Tax=Cardiosporidium cionae TaxID=476202 RepID=A0ABQ7J8C4_9APIC|nr:longevity-assurance protein (LAG1) domain-containing protein [Cardiosporidium cionae]|eukprot:KAF8820243.1 longevity-assurance protein (LAG1) domain-containing protein [Cardiosporidium cionae]
MKLNTIFISLLIAIVAGCVSQLHIAVTALSRRILESELGPKIRELKILRFCNFVFKALFFVTITLYAFTSLKEYEWFPEELGGGGNSSLFWEGYPFQHTAGFLRWYFYINGGFQLCSLIFLLTEQPMPDFWETLLQNTCAIFLISFSYLANLLRIGSVIMFCHDFCDIFSSGCKALVDTSLKPLTLCLFFCLVASWGYLRLYCFPCVCLQSILREAPLLVPVQERLGWNWFIFLLLTQLLMNIYWFSLMIKMFWHFIYSGQTVDMQSPVAAVELKS